MGTKVVAKGPSKAAQQEELKDDVQYGLLFNPKKLEVTDEQIAYFTENPDEIEEFSSSINIHSYFLFYGGMAGTILVALSKLIKYSDLLSGLGEGIAEFIIDIVFEIGVGMIGAVVTAYFLGVLLNRQQRNAAAWRGEIRQIIEANAAKAQREE